MSALKNLELLLTWKLVVAYDSMIKLIELLFQPIATFHNSMSFREVPVNCKCCFH